MKEDTKQESCKTSSDNNDLDGRTWLKKRLCSRHGLCRVVLLF